VQVCRGAGGAGGAGTMRRVASVRGDNKSAAQLFPLANRCTQGGGSERG
jgi:hypothetical protein